MRNLVLLFVLFFSLMSCRKERRTSTSNFIINNTSHNLKIIPFSKGDTSKTAIKEILKHDTKMVLNQDNRGKGTGFSYYDFLSFYDSVIVAFEDTIKAIHYVENSKGANPKAILSDSARSLYYPLNYQRKITSVRKYEIDNEYYYTFEEQDYLNAKNN